MNRHTNTDSALAPLESADGETPVLTAALVAASAAAGFAAFAAGNMITDSVGEESSPGETLGSRATDLSGPELVTARGEAISLS